MKGVLLSPTGSFQDIKKKKGIKEAFQYFLVLSFINMAIRGVKMYLNFGILSRLSPLLIKTIGVPAEFIAISAPLLVFAAGIIAIFLFSGLMHLFGYILGAKDFSATFKATAYSTTPVALLSWIPFVGFITPVWWLYLQVKGLSTLHNIGKLRSLAITAASIVLVVGILAFVFLFLLFSIFTALFQGLGIPLFG